MKPFRIAALAVCLSICACAQTTVQDTVRMQPGSVWSGEITITWPGFTTVDGRVVNPGQTVVVVNGGRLFVPLWPTVGATPTVAYFAHYLTTAGPNRGQQWDDPPWNVPASPAVVGLADIRPRSGAANTILSGTGLPSNLIGANGDFYLLLATPNCMYGPKAANAWPNTCTLLTGPPGIMQYGPGIPSNALGLDGQFYLDTDATCLYGPKASGAWPGICTSLISSLPPSTGLVNGDYCLHVNGTEITWTACSGSGSGALVLSSLNNTLLTTLGNTQLASLGN